MNSLDLENICTTLKELGHEASIQEESQQVLLPISVNEADYPSFFRYMADGEFLQGICFIPCTVIESAISDMARLLHMIDKELDMPGFGLDEKNQVVFFRMVIPTAKKVIDPKLTQTYLMAMHQVVSHFGALVQNVAMGKLSVKEVIRQMEQN